MWRMFHFPHTFRAGLPGILPIVLLASLLAGCAGHIAGNMELRQGEYAAAIQDLRAVVAEHPGLASARVDLARAYLYTGQDDKALAELRTAKASGPGAWQADYYLGVVPMLQGRTDEGLDALRGTLNPPGGLFMKRDIIGGTADLVAGRLSRPDFLNQARQLLLDAEDRQRQRDLENNN